MQTLDCARVRQMIAEASSQQLAAGMPGLAKDHIADCAQCAAYLKSLQAISDTLGKSIVPAPPEVYPNVVSALNPSPSIFTRRLIVLLCVLVAIMAAAAYVWHYYYKINNPEPDTIANKAGCSLLSKPTQTQSKASPSNRSRS